MAEIRPLKALHYSPGSVSSLGDVVAPPYDVIDAPMRAALLERSPFNVVEIDLPVSPGGRDPYAHAAETLENWTLQGILAADSEEALWALEQEYEGPDGSRYTRRGFLCRVRVTHYGPGLVRPHERTQPGPKEDRLRLTQATRHNLSPIFSLHEGNVWPYFKAAAEGEPWGEATDADGTINRIWRVTDPAVIAAVQDELSSSELLIADGHHRYETARTYADEVGGNGDHRYTLMALVSLEDPGLTVFGYHRLLTDLGDSAKQEAIAAALREHFEIEEVTLEDLDPAGEEGVGVFGYVDAHFKRGFRLRLKDTEAVDSELADYSEDYRRLDAAILETLILRGALGMTPEDVEAKKGMAYTASAEEAIGRLGEGVDAVFLMRPTPVDQVRAVAAAGETMPPKSTYFYPKLLTGLVFNPLE
ncbi:MAG: hypothetical protein QOI31_2439 [Solirubrobacterales bacterium]|jgi:uncharacterized protein (DUF1015 family)|nr:hypothetical protein [Solirubrobacterales bacterium]